MKAKPTRVLVKKKKKKRRRKEEETPTLRAKNFRIDIRFLPPREEEATATAVRSKLNC